MGRKNFRIWLNLSYMKLGAEKILGSLEELLLGLQLSLLAVLVVEECFLERLYRLESPVDVFLLLLKKGYKIIFYAMFRIQLRIQDRIDFFKSKKMESFQTYTLKVVLFLVN